MMTKRPLNDFVHCSCGITYISGYTHCPSCNAKNNRIPQIKHEVEANLTKTIDDILIKQHSTKSE